MAYMTKDGKGPYACCAGEYCGNHFKGSRAPQKFHDPPGEAERRHKVYLAKMRFGNPRSCEAFTTAEGRARGYVGLYLKEDEPASWRAFGDVLIGTPDELREPPDNGECDDDRTTEEWSG